MTYLIGHYTYNILVGFLCQEIQLWKLAQLAVWCMICHQLHDSLGFIGKD